MQRRILKRITIKDSADGTSTLSEDYKFDIPFFGGIKLVFIPRYVAFYKSYDPKKLAYIDGEYLDLNDVQQEYLSNIGWIKGNIKVTFIKLWSTSRKQFRRLIKKIRRFIYHD